MCMILTQLHQLANWLCSPLFLPSIQTSMGNTASCTPYRPAASAPVVRVIDRNGSISVHEHSRWQQQAMGSTAAELMLDYPGWFVCDSSQLEVGCRISGLSTEEELKRSHLYLLLPMNLLYSVLTEEEMVSFSCNSSSSKRRSYLSRKIFPVLSELCLIPPEAEKVVEEEHMSGSGADTIDDDKAEVSRQRSWRPALDTIEEDQ